jgi:imidazolonepropionase-like amidohydrolase
MKYLFPLALLLPCLSLQAQTYLTHAHLVDPVAQKVLSDQTIIYRGDTILQVGPSASIKTPKSAVVIDARGKWIMPGMVDAHVHFFQTGGLYTRPDAIDLRKYKPYEQEIAWYKQHMDEQLRRYLALGITTVIDDGATLALLGQRDTFASKTYAPRILMAGPLISTYDPKPFDEVTDPDKPIYLVKDPEEAVRTTQKEYPYHPDFIKIWYIILDPNARAGAEKNQPIVKATIEEAHAHGYKVAVHATERIAAQLAVEAGADFLVHDVEDEPVDDAFVRLLKDRGTVLCPTLVVVSGYFDTFGQRYTPTAEDIAIGDPEQLRSLQALSHLEDTAIANRYKLLAGRRIRSNEKQDSIRYINLKKMADAGVIIATGTDAGNIGTLHASSYFKELRAMQRAGLTNWQIITASTINGARALGKASLFGSIQPGKAADLLILGADPVADLANLRKLEGVVHRGVLSRPDAIKPH